MQPLPGAGRRRSPERRNSRGGRRSKPGAAGAAGPHRTRGGRRLLGREGAMHAWQKHVAEMRAFLCRPRSQGVSTEPLVSGRAGLRGRAVRALQTCPKARPRSQSDKDEPQGNSLAAGCRSGTQSPFKGGYLSHALSNTAPTPTAQHSSKSR